MVNSCINFGNWAICPVRKNVFICFSSTLPPRRGENHGVTSAHFVVSWLNDNSFSCQHRLTWVFRVALQPTETLGCCLLDAYTSIKSVINHYPWLWFGLLLQLGLFLQYVPGCPSPGMQRTHARSLLPCQDWSCGPCSHPAPTKDGAGRVTIDSDFSKPQGEVQLRCLLNTVQTTSYQICYKYFKMAP